MARTSPADHLANVDLFAGCSKKELSRIAKATDQLTLEDGHVLMTQDERAGEAFVIVSGKVVVKRNGRKVAELGPSDVLGELGLLDRGSRTATATADGPVEVLVIGPREFWGILDDTPAISRKLLSSLARTVRDLDSKAYG